ncbi:MAG: thiamine phosphate synthase [Pseudomonadales bacterium]|nr:thiamine phosphate synthase [Pseudomonadales bacterium]
MEVIWNHSLYAITPNRHDRAVLLQQVGQALAAGLRWLQYRDKCSDAAEKLLRALSLRELCHAYDCRLIINDDPVLCHQAGADGVHLGRSDGLLAEARAYLGSGYILGATCHNEMTYALQAAPWADYLAFGAFFPSPTKPQAPLAPLSLLKDVRSLHLPCVAIGGITPDNVAPVLAAGADAIAVISYVFDAPDIAEATRSFLNVLENAP